MQAQLREKTNEKKVEPNKIVGSSFHKLGSLLLNVYQRLEKDSVLSSWEEQNDEDK